MSNISKVFWCFGTREPTVDGHDVPIGGDCHSSPTAQQARKAGKAGGKDCAGIPNAGCAAPHHEYDEEECQALAKQRSGETQKD